MNAFSTNIVALPSCPDAAWYGTNMIMQLLQGHTPGCIHADGICSLRSGLTQRGAPIQGEVDGSWSNAAGAQGMGWQAARRADVWPSSRDVPACMHHLAQAGCQAGCSGPGTRCNAGRTTSTSMHHQNINAPPAHRDRQRHGAAAEGRLRQHAAGLRHMQWGGGTNMHKGILRGLSGALNMLAHRKSGF